MQFIGLAMDFECQAKKKSPVLKLKASAQSRPNLFKGTRLAFKFACKRQVCLIATRLEVFLAFASSLCSLDLLLPADSKLLFCQIL